MVQGYLTPKQQRLDLATIDEFAAQYGEYPVCYRGEKHWFFMYKGIILRGKEPKHARHALAEALRQHRTA